VTTRKAKHLSVENIEELIVRDSDGFFDDQEIREDLHITIRVATEFYEFLKRYSESPASEESDYVANTIRSGMDELYSLAFLCRTINISKTSWKVDRRIPKELSHLKRNFMAVFETLSEERLKPPQRLFRLIELGRLELLFLVLYFPFPVVPVVDHR
jgi:hypothetical protein